MRIREPVVAGSFYPAGKERCRSTLSKLLDDVPLDDNGGEYLYGGLVPHAGWAYSGPVTAQVLAALSRSGSPRIVVLFGGVHRSRGRQAALFADGRWETPVGPISIDHRLAERILGQTNLIVDDPYAHESEHSIEVQIPFIVELFPQARMVPIMVPCVESAAEIGEAVARTLLAYDYDSVVIGTTDLTHYGPSYGFVPHGVGAEANAWAKSTNDRRFIDLVCALRGEDAVAEATTYRNACSGGAVAATLAAVGKLGATRGTLMAHTSSAEVTARTSSEEVSDSVGYAGIVFS